MDSYKSNIVSINSSIATVYSKLSCPATLKNIENLGTIPEEVKAKMNEVAFDEDSITFNVNPVGQVTLKAVERIEPTKIVYQAVSLPIPLKMVINLTEDGEGACKAEADIQVELNMFIRPMVDKPLTEGAKKFGEFLAILPYDRL